jgi:alpha-L-fucosidase
VRWVGTESGDGRLTEWSVVPVDAQVQENIAALSQKNVAFTPKGNMMGEDLGGRDKILHSKSLVWYPAETDVSIRPGWFYHAAEDEKVKSPNTLMDIYFSSVGRNSLLLMNIPPDKNGLINGHDSANLKMWKQKLDATFGNNLARGAVIRSPNGRNASFLLDGRNDTHWSTAGKDSAATILFELPGQKTFDVLLLQENIRVGQRVEKFVLEYEDNGQWEKIADGTTIGYKRLLRFQPVTAHKVRLRIESSRLNPAIAEFGLFKLAE